MSTVSKDIADRIIAGDFAEDDISCIIKYQNIFNGADAYKIVPARMDHPDYINGLLYITPTMLNATIYWKREE